MEAGSTQDTRLPSTDLGKDHEPEREFAHEQGERAGIPPGLLELPSPGEFPGQGLSHTGPVV